MNPVTVEQLGVNIVYTPAKKLKGKGAGKMTMRGNFDTLTQEQRHKLVGDDKGIEELILRELNRRANGYVAAATDEQDEFDASLFAQVASGIPVAGDTMEELEERNEELSQKALDIVMNSINKGRALTTDEETTVKDISKERQEITAELNRKAAINEARVAKRQANAAAKAAGATPVAAAA